MSGQRWYPHLMAVDHETGVYAKGNDVRVANTRAQAVSLFNRGFTRQDDAPELEPEPEPEAETPTFHTL